MAGRHAESSGLQRQQTATADTADRSDAAADSNSRQQTEATQPQAATPQQKEVLQQLQAATQQLQKHHAKNKKGITMIQQEGQQKQTAPPQRQQTEA